MIKKGPRPTNIAKQREYDEKFQKPWSQKLGIDFLELIMAPDYTDADVLKICACMVSGESWKLPSVQRSQGTC